MDSGMDYISEHWKLCTEFSIVQAALLIAGYDPEDFERLQEHDIRAGAHGYSPARTALFNAVRSGSLTTTHTEYEYEGDGFEQRKFIDPYSTTISSVELDAFLKAKGKRCEFFESATREATAQLAKNHPQFPRKLDAAIKAWTAVTSDPASLRGKSPKQALAKWLTDHAEELGLLNRDGKPNKSGIEEICKVANWKPEGGAIPTPSAQPQTMKLQIDDGGGFQPVGRTDPSHGFQPAGSRDSNSGFPPRGPREEFSADLDDEIPW